MFSHNNICEGYLINAALKNAFMAHIDLYGHVMATPVRMVLWEVDEGGLLLLLEKE